MAAARPPTLDMVFAALADPTRRAILSMLLEDDMAVTDVAAPFAISLAAISKHIGVLTAAGLVSQDKRGRVTWCRLEPDALREASVWMQGFGQMESLDLDAFERFLAQELASPELPEAGMPQPGRPADAEEWRGPGANAEANFGDSAGEAAAEAAARGPVGGAAEP